MNIFPSPVITKDNVNTNFFGIPHRTRSLEVFLHFAIPSSTKGHVNAWDHPRPHSLCQKLILKTFRALKWVIFRIENIPIFLPSIASLYFLGENAVHQCRKISKPNQFCVRHKSFNNSRFVGDSSYQKRGKSFFLSYRSIRNRLWTIAKTAANFFRIIMWNILHRNNFLYILCRNAHDTSMFRKHRCF